MTPEAIAGIAITLLTMLANRINAATKGAVLRDSANATLAQTAQTAVAEIARLNSAFEVLQQRNAQLQAEIYELQDKYARERLWCADRMAVLENEIASLQAQNKRLAERLDELDHKEHV